MKLRYSIWRVGIWLLFPLLGFTAYFRSVGLKLPGYLILFMPYIAIIAYFQLKQSYIELHARILKKDFLSSSVFYLFIFLLLFASFRSTSIEYHSFLRFVAQLLFILVFSIFIRGYLYHIVSHDSLNLLWKDLSIALLISIILNLIARFQLGISSPDVEGYISELPSRISFLPYRIHFPFTTSTREFSYFGGLLVLLSGYMLADRQLFPRFFSRLGIAAVMMILGLLVIILTDSRMTLIMTIFFYAMIYLFLRWRLPRLITYGSIGAFALFPLVYLAGITTTGLINRDIFDITLTGRIYLWAAAVVEIPTLDIGPLLLGHGMFSQTTTGLSESFGLLFQRWTNSDLIPFHNSALQTILDQGIIGFGVYLVLLFTFAREFLSLIQRDRGSSIVISHIMVVSVLIYYIGLGTTESVTPFYYDSYLILLITIKAYLDVMRTKGVTVLSE